ncbi:ferredoxin [Lentzea flaviverrucosa]|uniref:Ferredoxin n=1 Tax=Lentzea flaviverrucosa TaxID=200379 RepID=A0A1H9XKE6_9PSEU|nr:ferredoxin [Lentzea flaviverrucosa]RDI20269.1 ferredoxin [Lentzea flaviverrucosa]SES46297.1 Ferredoxin [Lentzea flaviverrucosa]
MTVRIDQTGCIGSGQCVLAAPDVFDQSDDDGRGIVLVADPSDDLLPGVRDAVDRCPAQVVTLQE